jgi:hypothetical protein
MRRSLPGQLDYIRDQLTRITVLIVEATREADAQPHTRWVAGDLAHLGGDVAELVAKARELRAEMLQKGLGSHAVAVLGAPVPLVLKSHNATVERPALAREGRS